MSDLVLPEAAELQRSEAFALEALDAIDRVSTPEEAEDLLLKVKAYEAAVRLARLGGEQERRWGGVRLGAERRMGELLGPAENHGPTTATAGDGSSAKRMQKVRARALAAVPQDVFDEYLETAETPTRAGVLREVDHVAAVLKAKPKVDTRFADIYITAERLDEIADALPGLWFPPDEGNRAALRRGIQTLERIVPQFAAWVLEHDHERTAA